MRLKKSQFDHNWIRFFWGAEAFGLFLVGMSNIGADLKEYIQNLAIGQLSKTKSILNEKL